MTNHDHYGDIVLCALRYALWRHTYITSLVADYIAEHWSELDARSQHNILRDLGKHLRDVAEEWSKDTCNSIDLAAWKKLHATLTTKQNGL